MVDISDAKWKQLQGKPWSAWNLPGCSTEIDSMKLREAYKPKVRDKEKDHSNRLPATLKPLYGYKPEVEFFSVTKCHACQSVMKTQWISKHFKRDAYNNVVCRRTETIVRGDKCIGKAVPPLFDIRESSRDPMIEFNLCTPLAIKPPSSPVIVENYQISPRQKYVPPKTTHSSSGGSKSKSSSHSKKEKHTSSTSTSTSSKHKSSSSKVSSGSSRKESSKSSQKAHSNTSGSYVLSIPGSDSHRHGSLPSASHSSKHSIGKSKSPEFEQMKFYADSTERRSSRGSPDSKPLHKQTSATHGERFKIPVKSKTSSDSKKGKMSSSHSSSSHPKLPEGNKPLIRHIGSTIHGGKPVPSLTIISEPPKMNPPLLPHPIATPEVKKSHSKKKKKKKSRDEPRKIIPLKERAFNPDQHCGVIVKDNGQPCTRSLTCKTHSVALRRAVPGRSQAFDSLLAAHKKARDEEKARAEGKVIVEEPKPKPKKSSQPPTPARADSGSSSRSLLKQATTTHKSTGSSSSLPVGKSASPSVNNGSTVSALKNGKQIKQTISSSSSKHGNSHSVSQRHHVSKPASTIKATSRPVIIVDEKVEPPGPTLYDLRREPENSFICITRVDPPKVGNTKKRDRKKLKNTALSEWNPLDRFSRRGCVKKKGFKDPLVALFPVKGDGITSSVDSPSPKNDVTVRAQQPTNIKVEVNEGMSVDSAATEQAKDLKRTGVTITTEGGPRSKRARLLVPQKFYESLLFKKPSRDRGHVKQGQDPMPAKRPETLGEESMVKFAVNMITSHLTDIGYPARDTGDARGTARAFSEAISPEAREFVQNCVRAQSDNKDAVDKLSSEEVCEQAFELSSRCVLS